MTLHVFDTRRTAPFHARQTPFRWRRRTSIPALGIVAATILAAPVWGVVTFVGQRLDGDVGPFLCWIIAACAIVVGASLILSSDSEDAQAD